MLYVRARESAIRFRRLAAPLCLANLLTLSLLVLASASFDSSSSTLMKICRHNFISCLMLSSAVTLSFLGTLRAEKPEISGSIQEMMSPEEFKAAGLNKLSPDELAKLDAWLQGYRQVTEQAAEKKATARASRSKLDVLVSRVDGTLPGLTGRTIIRLEDGTVWKQANADDRYRPRNPDHPAAAVIHGVFGYKMQVEGMQPFYVDPIRNP